MSVPGKGDAFLDRTGDTYPNPFLNIASTWLPPSIRELFYWMEFFYATNPEAHRLCYDLASFPITDISIDDADTEVAETYREIFIDRLDAKSFLIELGLDFMVYGNAFAFVLYPFVKYMRCTACSNTQVMKAWKWKMRNKKLYARCEQCGGDERRVKILEMKVPDKDRLKLVRWSPTDMEIKKNGITDQIEYYYNPPADMRRKILAGDPFTIETTPQVIVDAIWLQKKIKPNPENFFHFRVPSPSGRLTKDGWGMPIMLTVMKTLYYLGVLRRGSEAVALEHIAPMRMVFPMSQGGMNPIEIVGLSRFKNEFEEGYRRWRRDPNHVLALPFPMGTQNFGGDANALMVTPEVESTRRSIATGLGVPLEFLDGTMSWSGSSVSLRVLGNRITNYMRFLKRFLRFSADKIGIFLGLPSVDQVELTDFKMADDPQRITLLLQLHQLGYVSAEEIVREATGKELDREIKTVKRENEELAEIQEDKAVRAAETQARAQIRMQEILAEAGMMGPGGGDPMAGGGMPTAAGDSMQAGAPPLTEQPQGFGSQPADANNIIPNDRMAYQYAMRLSEVSPQEQEAYLVQLESAGMVEMAQMIRLYLAQIMSGAAGEGGVDMRPLPEQKPPRRDSMNG